MLIYGPGDLRRGAVVEPGEVEDLSDREPAAELRGPGQVGDPHGALGPMLDHPGCRETDEREFPRDQYSNGCDVAIRAGLPA